MDPLPAEQLAAAMRAVVEHTPDFIGIADPDLKVLYVNPFGRMLFGGEADGPFPYERAPDYHPPWAVEVPAQAGLPAGPGDGDVARGVRPPAAERDRASDAHVGDRPPGRRRRAAVLLDGHARHLGPQADRGAADQEPDEPLGGPAPHGRGQLGLGRAYGRGQLVEGDVPDPGGGPAALPAVAEGLPAARPPGGPAGRAQLDRHGHGPRGGVPPRAPHRATRRHGPAGSREAPASCAARAGRWCASSAPSRT